MKKNIYLIEASISVGWDAFDSHVIIARNEKEARELCDWADEERETWLNPNLSSIKKIGETYKKNQCVLSSFNAG